MSVGLQINHVAKKSVETKYHNVKDGPVDMQIYGFIIAKTRVSYADAHKNTQEQIWKIPQDKLTLVKKQTQK